MFLAYVGVLYFVYRRTVARAEENQLRKWAIVGFVVTATVVFVLFLAFLYQDHKRKSSA